MKKIISLLLVMLMVFSLAACGTSGQNETEPQTEGQTEGQTETVTDGVTEPAGVSYPITVTDMAGR